MGNCGIGAEVSLAYVSKELKANQGNKSTNLYKANKIGNSFETKEQLNDALRKAGLEKCNLLVAIDFTKSNLWQGEVTFGGKSLHYIPQHLLDDAKNADLNQPPPAYNMAPIPLDRQLTSSLTTKIKRTASLGGTIRFDPDHTQSKEDILNYMKSLNPYQYVLSVAGSQLDSFDDDGYIPTAIFGYGRSVGDPYLKEINTDANGCHVNGCYKIDGVISAYEQAVKTNGLSGNTQMAPIIEWGISKVAKNREYNILLIIGDGCIDDLAETKAALSKAANYPLSVVFVGVGDGSDPKDTKDKWKTMRDLDDNPSGAVDNWQSVYIANLQEQLANSAHPDLDLATWMLMEIPEQYRYFKKNNLIKN